MERTGKGKGVKRRISDYCVLDLETTGLMTPVNNIIEISAVKVRGHKVVEEFSTLVNPLCRIPWFATKVNHITDDMVADAPTLDEVIDDFLSFVGNDIILGYNNAAFDMNVVYDALTVLRGESFGNDYLDLLYSARRCFKGILENNKLETVSKHYNLDTEGEHRALKDCYLTKDCYDKMYAEFGEKMF